MVPALVGCFLILTLVYVSLFVRAEPLQRERPLDVDRGLPFPAAGQASSIFSLSALFGAYLGMAVLLGRAAILGVVCGGIAGLCTLRWAILRSRAASFEEFLAATVFPGTATYSPAATLLFFVQVGFAASELLILRELLATGFSLAPSHATALATAVGLVAYFYCLFGGYAAVYRTDVIQFVFVILLCLSLFVWRLVVVGLSPGDMDQTEHWTFSAFLPTSMRAALHFVIGAGMGFSFLAANPDTWKRVFVVSTRKHHAGRGFAVVVIAGLCPFLLVLPLALGAASRLEGSVNLFDALPDVSGSQILFALLLLGLIASFLSSFDSALISAAHIALLQWRRPGLGRTSGLDTYYYVISGSFFTVSFLFLALMSVPNAYFLANFLLGPFALFGGVAFSLLARRASGGAGAIVWMGLAGLGCWVAYLLQRPAMLTATTTAQVDTIPIGMLLFFIGVLGGMLAWRQG